MLLLIHLQQGDQYSNRSPVDVLGLASKFLDHVKRLPLVAFSPDGLNGHAKASPRVAEVC
jgi:hypothetical protein